MATLVEPSGTIQDFWCDCWDVFGTAQLLSTISLSYSSAAAAHETSNKV